MLKLSSSFIGGGDSSTIQATYARILLYWHKLYILTHVHDLVSAFGAHETRTNEHVLNVETVHVCVWISQPPVYRCTQIRCIVDCIVCTILGGFVVWVGSMNSIFRHLQGKIGSAWLVQSPVAR